jgi:predicted enzyme related to lactoylglutathione lyase
MKKTALLLAGLAAAFCFGFTFKSIITNDADKAKATLNPVVHFEVGCKDLAKTTVFYTSVFGWAPTDSGASTYLNTNTTEGIQGHITALGHEPFDYVTFYVQVDDIPAYIQKIQAAGGSKIVGPIKLPRGQAFAWVRDPEGNAIGLLTKATN